MFGISFLVLLAAGAGVVLAWVYRSRAFFPRLSSKQLRPRLHRRSWQAVCVKSSCRWHRWSLLC